MMGKPNVKSSMVGVIDTSMGNPKIRLYVDAASQFSYFALFILRTSHVFTSCEIEVVPVTIGGIFKYCNNQPPFDVKNKGAWLLLERKRWSKAFDIPLADKMPEPFPVNSMPVQRALCAVSLVASDKTSDAVEAIFEHFFVGRESISKPEDFMPVIRKVLGDVLAKRVEEMRNTEEVKTLLHTNTDAAIKDGAFGLPWFAATNAKGEKECFWGFDRIGQVAQHMGLERPARKEANAGWNSML